MSEEEYRNYAVTDAGVYPDEAFEGELVEHWDNGLLKFKGKFDQGRKRTGLHVCYWENGALHEVAYWRDGWNVGTLLRFRENGTRQTERNFGENGSQSQSWTEKRFGSDGQQIATEEWKDGSLIAKWVDDRVANAIKQAQAQLENEAN